MHIWSYIAEKFATPTGLACRGRRLFGLLVAMMGIGVSLQAQEINVGNVVMSIPAGVTVSTEGGITLQDEGAIANDGTLEVGGNWINNGKGLLKGGKGKVVLNGKDQRIGGVNSSEFHDLAMVGGAKELGVDVRISGLLVLEDCAVITHFHAFALLHDDVQHRRLSNALVIAERAVPMVVEAVGFDRGGFPGGSGDVLVAAVAVPAGPSTSSRFKAREGGSRAKASGGAGAWPGSVNATASVLYSLRNEMIADLLPSWSDNSLPMSGATAAIQAMYFSSEMDGEHLPSGKYETTRNPWYDLDAASSFFAQHNISIYSA